MHKKIHKFSLGFGPIIFLIIGILAASKRPFHGDEVGSFHLYLMTLSDIFSTVFRTDIHPPLSYMISKYITNVASPLESSILPLLFLSLSLYFFIKVTYEYLGTSCKPSIYSFIISLHPSLIIYGFTTRYYSFHISISLIALTLLIKFISGKSNKDLYLIFIVLIVGAYTSYISLLLSFVIGIVLLYDRTDLWKKILILGCIYSVLISPVILNLVNIIISNNIGLRFEGINMTTLSYFVGAYELIIGNTIPPSDIFGMTIAFLIFCLALISLYKLDYRTINKTFFYLVFIFLLLFTLSIYTHTITKIRSYIFLSPVLFFLLLFLLSLNNGKYSKRIRQLTITLLLLLNTIGVNNLLHTNSISGWYNYPYKLKQAINSEVSSCSKDENFIFLDYSSNNAYLNSIKYIQSQIDNECTSLLYSSIDSACRIVVRAVTWKKPTTKIPCAIFTLSELDQNLLKSGNVEVKVIVPIGKVNKKLVFNNFSVSKIKPIVPYNYDNKIRSKIIQLFYENGLPYDGARGNYRFNLLYLKKKAI